MQVSAWVSKYLEGSLQPYRKSAPIPPAELNPGPLFDVVGSNFEDIVLDSSMNVAMFYHQPWYGYVLEVSMYICIYV